MKSIVYLDMDGVLADFEGKAVELFGKDWEKEINRPNWGRFSEYPNLYEILNPMPDAMDLYNGVVGLMGGDKNRVQCLTALPNRARDSFPHATRHKIEWARKYIDPKLRVHFGPLAQDKQYHVQHEHDVLIDDMYLNIKQWRAAGGIGIVHTSAANSILMLKGMLTWASPNFRD